MTDLIRVGVIGCGGIAQMMHIPNVVETPGFELAALADTDDAVLGAVARRYGVAQRYRTWQELLASADIDAVIICHGGSHRESVLAALDAGKHILVEKPLAWNHRETLDIAQRAASSDRVVQVGYHKLYDPGYHYARRELSEFEDLAFVECTVLHAADEFNRAPYAVLKAGGELSQFNYLLPDWETLQRGAIDGLTGGELGVLTREALAGRPSDVRLEVAFGMLTQSVIHQIYTLFGFLGEPEGVLHSEFWRGGHSMHILIAFPNEVRCALNWHNLPYLNDYHESYAFFGNRRRLRFDLPGPYYRNFPSPVTVQGGEGELSWEKRVIVSYREAFHNELLAFGEAIRSGARPVSGVEQAVKHHAFIESIVRAAR